MSNVPPADKGRRRAVIERVRQWMEDFLLEQDYARFTVTADKDYDVMRAKYRPVITIAFGEQESEVEVYGRLYPNTNTMAAGITVRYPFSLFIYMDRTEEHGKSHNYHLHLLTDALYKFLRTKWRDSLEMENYGILGVDEVIMRESDPQGMLDTVRMIISAQIEVIRIDNP